MHNPPAPPVHRDSDHGAVLPLHGIGCDPFEQALLPLLREVMKTCRDPERHTWNGAYGTAAAIWGARTGLPLAYGLARIAQALLRVKGARLHVLDGSGPEQVRAVTDDERRLLLLLHQLRRNHIAAGHDFLLELTEGESDDELMALALDFARRHSCGAARDIHHDGPSGPHLRPV